MQEIIQQEPSVKDYVLQDEKLLWTGKPVKPIKLLPGEKFNIIFGIFWTAFAIFWMILAFVSVNQLEEPQGWLMKIFPYFGIPFLLVGLYLIFLSPLRIMSKRKNIEYALTTKRILIFNNGKTQTLDAFYYTDIQNVNFGCDSEGIGAVTFFNTKAGLSTVINGQPSHSRARTVSGFYNIADVKKVYKIFCKQMGEMEQ